MASQETVRVKNETADIFTEFLTTNTSLFDCFQKQLPTGVL